MSYEKYIKKDENFLIIDKIFAKCGWLKILRKKIKYIKNNKYVKYLKKFKKIKDFNDQYRI